MVQWYIYMYTLRFDFRHHSIFFFFFSFQKEMLVEHFHYTLNNCIINVQYGNNNNITHPYTINLIN